MNFWEEKNLHCTCTDSDVPLGIFPKECSREQGIFSEYTSTSREISLKKKSIIFMLFSLTISVCLFLFFQHI